MIAIPMLMVRTAIEKAGDEAGYKTEEKMSKTSKTGAYRWNTLSIVYLPVRMK